MTGLQSNVFPILNLAELSSGYRLYRIRGLAREHQQYYQNLQIIGRRLSYSLKNPVTVVEHDGHPQLVLRDDAPEPESPFQLVRTIVYFDPLPGTHRLDFMLRNPENDAICLRFLQFMLQAPLGANPKLWQPGSGKPFFDKTPAQQRDNLNRYVGFSARVVATPDGGLGLCVDVCNKVVSTASLPIHLNLPEFRKLRGLHCIYHFGHRWYEVQLRELSDLTASEFLVPRGEEQLPLLEYIAAASQKPIPNELATLPHDASVVMYMTNREELHAAPSGLCYPVYGPDEQEARLFHASTLLMPGERRAKIHRFISDYLSSLRFGDSTLRVSSSPINVAQRMFVLPDYEYGKSHILSVRGTQGAQQVSLDQIGRTRAALLRDKQAGFYINDRLERQYLLLPQTVADSFGQQFAKDLCQTVDDLFPDGQYEPIIVTYNDRGPRTFVEQGKTILTAAQQSCTKSGYALVMIHHTADRLIRQHDQLAAMVVREFRKFDVCAAVNHSAMGLECYELVQGRDGQPIYRIRESKRGRFFGYLRGVALNKILLTNERWPFVLATPLHADLTIGIDVKEHTAGFTVVGRDGGLIRTICRESSQQEQLLPEQIKKYLVEIVRKEASESGDQVRSLVIHRDGRLWEAERPGVYEAMKILKDEGTGSLDAKYAILEIPKTSQARVRLFDVTEESGRKTWVENPQVGSYWVVNQNDAYVCATGRAFPRQGTVRPLHVRYVEGELAFEECLEDLYYLTALTWTRPEDCTRYPITIKLTDRRLGEDASEFDADALELHESEPQEELT